MPYNPPSSPLNYPTNAGNPARIFSYSRAPTSADYANFQIRDFWIDNSSNDLYFLVDKGAGSSTWIILGGTGVSTETLTGNTGGAVGPDGSNNINVVGTAPISVAGNPGTNTLTIDTDGTVAESYPTDSGTAIPSAGVLQIVGGGHIATVGSGNTVTINAADEVAAQFDTDAGTAIPVAGVLDVLGGTGVDTAGAGSTVTINASTDVATSYVTDSGTATPASNILNVLGGTGIDTSGATDTLTIDAATDVATTYTADSGSAAPSSNNINFVGDGGVTTTATGSTVTIHSSGGGVAFYNLGITYSGSTFSVTAADGSALSSSNKAFINIRSSSAPGTTLWIPVTANQSFEDATGTSDITGNLFGLTTSIAHADDIPFFIYAVLNDSEDDIAFMISRFPYTLVSPVDTKIGQSGSAIADTQGSFFSLKSITATAWDSNPCIRVGSFKMTMDASDDWTVTALDKDDGMGRFQERVRFMMSLGQFGANSGNYFIDNGGTAPTLTAASIAYLIDIPYLIIGWTMEINVGGAGAVALSWKIPFISNAGPQPNQVNAIYTAAGVPTFIAQTVNVSGNNTCTTDGTNPTNIRTLLNTDINNGELMRGLCYIPPRFT